MKKAAYYADGNQIQPKGTIATIKDENRAHAAKFNPANAVALIGVKRIRSTYKAWLVNINGREMWLPMSQMWLNTYNDGNKNFDVIFVANWLAEKNNLTGLSYAELNEKYTWMC